MMKVLKFILENWYLVLIAGVLIGGFIYRTVTHQPFKSDIPPVGVMNDLPSSVTGMNKHSDKM